MKDDSQEILFIEFSKHHGIIPYEFNTGNFQLCGDTNTGIKCIDCKVNKLCSVTEKALIVPLGKYKYFQKKYPEYFL